MNEAIVPPQLSEKLPVIVEAARPEDAAEVFDVQKLTWLATYPNDELGITREYLRRRLEGEHGELTPQKVASWRESIEVAGPDSDRSIFVVREAGKILGFIASSVREDMRRIRALYVLPEAQGKGIGGALLQQAIAWHGRERDIFLNVASYNQNAIDFYKRYGFEVTDKVVIDEAARQNGQTEIPEIEMVLRPI